MFKKPVGLGWVWVGKPGVALKGQLDSDVTLAYLEADLVFLAYAITHQKFKCAQIFSVYTDCLLRNKNKSSNLANLLILQFYLVVT